MKDGSERVTRLLHQITSGDGAAADQLLPVVYRELKDLARARMARERPGQTLQPTALVHEAYLRLVGDPDLVWKNRRHFFAAAAEAMRRILIERARRAAAQKRGGDARRVTFASDLLGNEARPAELLALDEAVERLAALDPGMAEVVKLRFFGGLTVAETAQALEISPRSVNRTWTAARAWLYREMGSDSGESGGPAGAD